MSPRTILRIDSWIQLLPKSEKEPPVSRRKSSPSHQARLTSSSRKNRYKFTNTVVFALAHTTALGTQGTQSELRNSPLRFSLNAQLLAPLRAGFVFCAAQVVEVVLAQVRAARASSKVRSYWREFYLKARNNRRCLSCRHVLIASRHRDLWCMKYPLFMRVMRFASTVSQLDRRTDGRWIRTLTMSR